jgi:hypothetical protein
MKTRSDGLTLISLYHFLSGFVGLLAMCAIIAFSAIIGLAAGTSGDPDSQFGTAIMGVIGLFVGGMFLLIAIANVVIGWGLWQRRAWARLGALVLALLRLINFPLCTLIGGWIIWYLLQENTKAEFAE